MIKYLFYWLCSKLSSGLWVFRDLKKKMSKVYKINRILNRVFKNKNSISIDLPIQMNCQHRWIANIPNAETNFSGVICFEFYFNKYMKHRLKIFSRTLNGLGVLKLYNHVCLLNYLLLIELIKIISKNGKLTFHYIYVLKFTFKFQSYEAPNEKSCF